MRSLRDRMLVGVAAAWIVAGTGVASAQQGVVTVLLNGTWKSAAPSAGANPPAYKPELRTKVASLEAARPDPAGANCEELGLPRIGPPQEIVQLHTRLIFRYSDFSNRACGKSSQAFCRVIPMGEDLGERNTSPGRPMGRSVGLWDELTLVLETVGFDGRSWLTDRGHFHSSEMKVTERIRRDGDVVHYEVTVDDPTVLAKPWVVPYQLTPIDRSVSWDAINCIPTS